MCESRLQTSMEVDAPTSGYQVEDVEADAHCVRLLRNSIVGSHQQKVARQHTIPTLVRFLTSEDQELVRQCVICLGCFAKCDDIDRSIFPDFTLTSVTNVLCHSCEPKVQEACARCLKNLLKHGLGASPVIPEAFLERMLELLGNSTPAVQECMCLALGQACTLDPALCLSSSCGALLVVMSSMLSQSQSTTNVRTAVLSAIAPILASLMSYQEQGPQTEGVDGKAGEYLALEQALRPSLKGRDPWLRFCSVRCLLALERLRRVNTFSSSVLPALTRLLQEAISFKGDVLETLASLLRGNKSAQKAAIDADLVSRVVPIMHPPSGKDAPDQSIILVHYRYRGC